MFQSIKTPELVKIRQSSNQASGLTLIEVVLYCFLLSFLLVGFIRYAIETHLADWKIQDDVIHSYDSEF